MVTPKEVCLENIVELDSYRPFDPILRKGDVVRIVGVQDDSLWLEGEEEIMEYEGETAIVTAVCMSLPDDHPVAPGQAMYVDLAMIPHEDLDDPEWERGWMTFSGISCDHLHRVIGDSQLMRSGRL